MENEIPKIGEKWIHRNGIEYEVMFLTNTSNIRKEYPVTVVYKNIKNETFWSRPLSEWNKSFAKRWTK